MQFLLDLEQIFFKYFCNIFCSIFNYYEMVSGIEFGNKISKRNWEMENLQLYWKEDILQN